jgi:5-methylcytosine-specific restriction endonuclease McrA
MKVCTACSQAKPDELFALSNKTKSGLSSRCRSCESLRHIEFYKKKKDRILLSNKEYREQNHERRLEIERASRAKNKEKNRPSRNARQSIRNKAIQGGKYLILDRELRRIYSSPCFMCGCKENQSLDHIVPISRGGSHSVGNIMTLCLQCNMSKHARTIAEWKHSMNMLGVG